MKRKYFAFIVVLFLFLFQSRSALALEVTYPNIFGYQITQGSSIGGYVAYFFVFLVVTGGILGVISIAIAGFRILIGGGSPTAIQDARERIVNAVLGLILLMSSFLILNTINSQLVVLETSATFLPLYGIYKVDHTQDPPRLSPLSKAITNTLDASQIDPRFTKLAYKCETPGRTLLVWVYNLPNWVVDRNANGGSTVKTYRIPCGSTEEVDISATNGVLSFYWEFEDAGIYYFMAPDCGGIASWPIQKVSSQVPPFDALGLNDRVRSMRIVSGIDQGLRYGVVLNAAVDGEGECSKPILNLEPGALCYNMPINQFGTEQFYPLYSKVINQNPLYALSDNVNLYSQHYWVQLQENSPEDPYSPYIGSWYTYNGDSNHDIVLNPQCQTNYDECLNACQPDDPDCSNSCQSDLNYCIQDSGNPDNLLRPPPDGLGELWTEEEAPEEECTKDDPFGLCLNDIESQGSFYTILYASNPITLNSSCEVFTTNINGLAAQRLFDYGRVLYRMDIIPQAP